MVSSNSTGGFHPETLYDLALKTNGFCVFSDDDQLVWVVGTPVLNRAYLVYSANAEVYGNQMVHLPEMNLPGNCRNWFSATIQDNDLMGSALYEWGADYKLGLLQGASFGSGSGNFRESSFSLDNKNYNISLTCKFEDTKTRRLMFRVYFYTASDHWIPIIELPNVST